jgi:hypothetical protein
MTKVDKAKEAVSVLGELSALIEDDWFQDRLASTVNLIEENIIKAVGYEAAKQGLQPKERIEVEEAKVLKVDHDYKQIRGYNKTVGYYKITILDERYGKVWFTTRAKFADELKKGDRITASLMLTQIKPNILFAKKPTKVKTYVENEGVVFENVHGRKVA